VLSAADGRRAPRAAPTLVLIGLESSGKSALFRAFTGQSVGDELNFRGSTVRVRSGWFAQARAWLVDTPGIRFQEDTQVAALALRALATADQIIVVVRGTHFAELRSLLSSLGSQLEGRRVAVVFTFADRASAVLHGRVHVLERSLGVPVAIVNARAPTAAQKRSVLEAMLRAAPLRRPLRLRDLPVVPTVQPRLTLFEHRRMGPWLAIAAIVSMFGAPVWAAYRLSELLQPICERVLISRVIRALAPLRTEHPLAHAILGGDYGVLTLGWYSLLWALPVVLLIGCATAITEESGIKDRVTAALDPWLRRIGLNGRDLIPVLSGFGCNVVAVMQTRSCSACTRKPCVALIAFGSACSYQIGASLSIFGSARAPSLFAPYLVLLFVVGALHTRMWNRALAPSAAVPVSELSFLQRPTWRGMRWRVHRALRQFVFQAIPAFFSICLAGAALQYYGALDALVRQAAGVLRLIGLPEHAAPAVVFALVRKDGLLLLNRDQGALLSSMSRGQVLLAVYLGSTLLPCLVTLLALAREVGTGSAAQIAGRQLLTSCASALVLGLVLQRFT
jgi:ferrous iron transport protein B